MLLNEAMRDYMNVLGEPEGAEDAPELMPMNVDQTSQTTPNQGEVHGIEYNPEVDAPQCAASMDSSAMGGVASRMRELTQALQQVLGKTPEQVDEQSTPEESPEAMAPNIDSEGHQDYQNPKGDSYAEKAGFTG